jgi:hypothetical protein
MAGERESIEQGPAHITGIHQDGVYRHRRGAASFAQHFRTQGHQRNVHQNGGYTAGNIAQKRRTSADNDLFDHCTVELWLYKFQQRLIPDKWDHGNYRRSAHSDGGCQGRTYHIHPAAQQEEHKQTNGQDITANIDHHTGFDKTADPQVIVHSEEDGSKRTA